MPQVLVTGATGFLGSHLLRSLIENGYKVIVLKRQTSDLWRIHDLSSNVDFVNLEDVSIHEVFESNQFDLVIHTACDYGRQGHTPSVIAQTNLMFGLQLLEAASMNGVKAFINTDTLLQRDINAYALSKHQLADWLKFFSNKIKVVSLRLEHMYGPGDDDKKFVSWLIQQFQNNVSRIPLTDGKQKRDFVYISDVVNAYLIVCERIDTLPQFNEFDVGSGVLTNVQDFVKALYAAYKKYHPECVTELGFGDIAMREGELMDVVVNLSALKLLGWKSEIALDAGIEQILKERL